jgi:uncharacterized membrane protein YbaN (DUF454 family)
MASAFSEVVHEALEHRVEPEHVHGDWVALEAFAGTEPWEVSGRGPGQVRLRHAGLVDRERRAAWLDRMSRMDGVMGCRAGWFSDSLSVTFDRVRVAEARVLDHAHAAWLELEARTAQPSTDLDMAAVPISRLARYSNLAMAGGSFALTLIGLAVPGIPTVPFLLATSYYLARSSPRLNRALLHSTFFGPILYEWETHHALSRLSKRKLLGLTGVIVAVTLVVTPLGPVALILILAAVLISVYGLLRLPGIPQSASETARMSPALVPF